MFEVRVEDEFSAAHFLKLYDGSYEPKHGHLWKVQVVVQSEKLDSMGVVVDFEWLKPALKNVLNEFHHQSVNEHPSFANDRLNPSTENIARWIYEALSAKLPNAQAHLARVTVFETPDCSASFVGENR